MVMADRPNPEAEPAPDTADDGGSPELEREVAAIAAWFEALPPEWQRYFDHEAESGRTAYGPA